MKQEYPKMVYKTRDDYTTVGSEEELKMAMEDGYGELEQTPEAKAKSKQIAKVAERAKIAEKAKFDAEERTRLAEHKKLKDEIKAEIMADLQEEFKTNIKAAIQAEIESQTKKPNKNAENKTLAAA